MGVKRFAAVNTKVRALESHLLKREDYDALLEMETLQAMVEYLKRRTSYADYLDDIQDKTVSIDMLEVVFKRAMFQRIQGLIHYFTDAYKQLFKTLFMRYEIEDLKLFIRALIRKEDLSQILEHLVILGINKNIDYTQLKRVNTLEGLLEAIKDTPYSDLIEYYMDELPQKRIFYMEMNLDRFYFKKLLEQVKKLEATDRAVLSEILGKNTDLLNLQWIYRGRKFYGLSAEELLNYTLLGGRYMNYRQLKELCYAKSMEEAITLMRSGPYGFLVEGSDFEVFMELDMERYIYDEFLKLKKSNRMNIIESMVYMHQLEYEVRDLFTIFEANRYGLGKNEVLKYLVRVRPE
jgi:V/A-type H+-transporting ATPase subunit C